MMSDDEPETDALALVLVAVATTETLGVPLATSITSPGLTELPLTVKTLRVASLENEATNTVAV